MNVCMKAGGGDGTQSWDTLFRTTDTTAPTQVDWLAQVILDCCPFPFFCLVALLIFSYLCANMGWILRH